MTLQVHPADGFPAGTTAAEALVGELVAHGVEVVFLNPGTDTAPVQEAIAVRSAAGLEVPRVVLCPHEAVALAAAHAYFAVTGRPQAVFVHVDVGTQNLGAMLHNALRAEAGVVIIAGRTPVTAHGELPGGRDLVVHWQQDVPDQAGIVRSYAKWIGDLQTPQTVVQQVGRAFQLARSAPSGPVYLTAAREVLMAPMPQKPARRDERCFRVPAPAAPNPAALEEAIQILSSARRPVIVTSRLGRDLGAMADLEALVEALDATVVDRRERVNFPSSHPAYATDRQQADAALAAADAVLVVDCVVPWVPLHGQPPPDASIVILDADPVKASIPGWSFPADVMLQADPAIGLRALRDGLGGARDSLDRRRRDSRRTAEPRATRRTSDVGNMPLPPSVAVQGLNDVLAVGDIVIEETTTNADAIRAGLTRTMPGTLFQPGGSGLGWALGGALGAKLASPDRRVVAVLGDGSFQFGNPAAALWAAKAAGAPFLAVVLANGGYAASRRPVFDLFPDGASAAMCDVVGTRFDDPPDLALLARACGGLGEHVTRAAELRPALERGLRTIDAGSCAVVVIPVTSPWFSAREATS